MNFLTRYLQSRKPAQPAPEQQAILIHMDNEDLDASTPVQLALYELLQDSDLGEFDGNEVGGGQLVLFLYGPDAELLFKHIEPTLIADPYCHGARAVIRWGGPQAPSRQVILGSTVSRSTT